MFACRKQQPKHVGLPQQKHRQQLGKCIVNTASFARTALIAYWLIRGSNLERGIRVLGRKPKVGDQYL